MRLPLFIRQKAALLWFVIVYLRAENKYEFIGSIVIINKKKLISLKRKFCRCIYAGVSISACANNKSLAAFKFEDMFTIVFSSTIATSRVYDPTPQTEHIILYAYQGILNSRLSFSVCTVFRSLTFRYALYDIAKQNRDGRRNIWHNRWTECIESRVIKRAYNIVIRIMR